MTILAYEPNARTQWRRFYRNRRIASHLDQRHGGSVLVLTLLASLAFWIVAGYGLSQIL